MKWLRAAVPPFGALMRKEEHSRKSYSKRFQETLSHEERLEGHPVVNGRAPFVMYELQLDQQTSVLDRTTNTAAKEAEDAAIEFYKHSEEETVNDTPIQGTDDSVVVANAPEQSAPLMSGPGVTIYVMPLPPVWDDLCPANHSSLLLSPTTRRPQADEQSFFLLETKVSSNIESFSVDAKDTIVGEATIPGNSSMAAELGSILASALIPLGLVVYFYVTRFYASKRGKEKQQTKLNGHVNAFSSATTDECQTRETAHLTQEPELKQKQEAAEEIHKDAGALEDLLEDLALAKKPAPLTSLTALLAQSLFSPIKIYRIPAPKKECKNPQEVQDHHELVHFCSRSIVVPCDPLEGYRPTTLLGGIQERVRQSCFPSPRTEKRNSVRRDSLILNTLGLPVGVDETSTPTPRSSFSLMASSILTQNRFFPAMTSAIANAAAGQHQ